MTDEGVYGNEVMGLITHGLLRLSTAMRNRAWNWAERAGLTPTQGEILVLLMQRRTPLRLGEIARQTALTAATTSDAVSTLEGKGLVEKRRALDDGRALAVRLTTKGRTAAKRATQWPAFLQAAAKGLPEDEQAALYRSLLKIIHDLESKSLIPPHRMCLTCDHLEAAKTTARTSGKPATRASKTAAAPAHWCNLLSLALPDTALRLDCPVYEEANETTKRKTWKIFAHIA